MKKENVIKIVETMYRYFSDPIEQIHQKSGIARSTISKFFNRRSLKPSTTQIIYITCINLIEEKVKQGQENDKKLNNLLGQLEN